MITVKQNCTHMDAFVQTDVSNSNCQICLGRGILDGFYSLLCSPLIVLIVTIDVSLLQNTVLL